MIFTREMNRFKTGVSLPLAPHIHRREAYSGLAAIRDAALCWATIGPTTAGILNIESSNVCGNYDLQATVACLREAGAVNCATTTHVSTSGPIKHIYLTCQNHPDLRWCCKAIAWVDGRYTGTRSLLYMGSICDANQDEQAEECQCEAASLIIAPSDGVS